jgi:cold shock CspA family protein
LRFQGKIKSWNQAKGLGFISPNGGGDDVFIHISEFENRRKMPKITNLVTYEVNLDEKNRKQAVNVKFVGEITKDKQSSSIWSSLLSILVFIVIGLIVRDLYQHRGSSIQSTFYKSLYLRDYDPSRFTCEGKTHCSEMSSCEEALYYEEKCSGTEMDGDYDGIPCEQQWCSKFNKIFPN